MARPGHRRNVAALGCTLAALSRLCCWRSEVHELCNKKYASAALPGIFSALTFILENFALANGLSATSVVLLNKCAILPGVLGEIWLTRTTPYRTQLLTMAALPLCITVYSLGDEGEINMSLVGLLLGLGAALSDGFGDIAFEATALDDLEENSGAETLRCMLVNELYKSVLNIILMFVFEHKHFSQGLFHGWGVRMLVGGVLPLPMMVALHSTAILTTSNLESKIAASADIGIAYLMEALIFGDAVSISQCLLSLAIFALIGVYTKFAIYVRKAAADALIRSWTLDVEVICRV
ncbi:unnamed protein product [Prorocentrum cordatum]|uniref:Solute carrier family 40 protein n=1 Tax=Prorocentrum cordatum TaxID=2364126 RepID=A0ABN9SEF2_9DINO|nr:unnamed protein product [Polarella glacialis]